MLIAVTVREITKLLDSLRVMRACLLTPDLFFASQLQGMARAAGWQCDLAGTMAVAADRLSAGACDCVIVDLETPGFAVPDSLEALNVDPAHTIAFAPHVHEHRINEAKAVGIAHVLSRGRISRDLGRLLSGWAADASG